MADSYPYTLATDKLAEFMKKLQAAGVPDRIDDKLLKTHGFTSSNHRSFPAILRFVGLVDSRSVPTDRYKAVRSGEQGKIELGTYITESYSQLFKTLPDAHRKDAEALRNFFKAHTSVGDRAVGAMASTFQTLCEFASFNGERRATPNPPPAVDSGLQPPPPLINVGATPITINVNIQLEIQATTDKEVYEAFFAAMAKHILRLEKP